MESHCDCEWCVSAINIHAMDSLAMDRHGFLHVTALKKTKFLIVTNIANSRIWSYMLRDLLEHSLILNFLNNTAAGLGPPAVAEKSPETCSNYHLCQRENLHKINK